MENSKWTENVILVDAEHVDKVAFDLIVNFERMLGRRIPQADMARWIDCVALDGGVREGEHETLVVFIHDKERRQLENFTPAVYDKELDGQAFRDHLGEFSISALPVEAVTTKADFFIDTLQLVCAQKEVRRVMVIPGDSLIPTVRQTLNRIDDDNKRITLFAMQPLQGGNFRQEILGYSLMAAMGIRSEEILGNEK
jgi:hypothetical protein